MTTSAAPSDAADIHELHAFNGGRRLNNTTREMRIVA